MEGILFINHDTDLYEFENSETGEIKLLGSIGVNWIKYLEENGWSYNWTHADGHTHYFNKN